jgi:hypothetical protein
MQIKMKIVHLIFIFLGCLLGWGHDYQEHAFLSVEAQVIVSVIPTSTAYTYTYKLTNEFAHPISVPSYWTPYLDQFGASRKDKIRGYKINEAISIQKEGKTLPRGDIRAYAQFKVRNLILYIYIYLL